GFRPLLAWDSGLESSADKKGKRKVPDRLLSIVGGMLVLEDLDIVAKAGEPTEAPPRLVSLSGAALHARRCTFSTAGKFAQGLAAVESRRPQGKPSAEDIGPRIRLDRCYLRGGQLTAVRVGGPADVLLERCLVVGGD